MKLEIRMVINLLLKILMGKFQQEMEMFSGDFTS